MRELTRSEASNVAFLVEAGLDYGLLETTRTILGKSYFDATLPFRAFLKRENIHDFDSQGQGEEHKRSISGFIVSDAGLHIPATTTLYRPATKTGDPRIWFSKLHHRISSDEIAAVIWRDDALWLLNASTADFRLLSGSNAAVAQVLAPARDSVSLASMELLGMMREISARGYIKTHRNGNTAAGHLLETELGIQQNSSKSPDFKGIEIKSSRATAARSTTMFAKVPDWKLSALKSSNAILDEFGYFRDGKLRLNCSVSASVFNSQGLRFSIDDDKDLLEEISTNTWFPEVATWEMQVLRDELAKKHRDTFWVHADSKYVGGFEYVHFTKVRHTNQPLVEQLTPMLKSGSVYMDHLISRAPDAGSASERGPLFKIQNSSHAQLFPDPIEYELQV